MYLCHHEHIDVEIVTQLMVYYNLEQPESLSSVGILLFNIIGLACVCALVYGGSILWDTQLQNTLSLLHCKSLCKRFQIKMYDWNTTCSDKVLNE
jgi:hypothetical protein